MEDAPRCYAIGDGAGFTRSLAQAGAQGRRPARVRGLHAARPALRSGRHRRFQRPFGDGHNLPRRWSGGSRLQQRPDLQV